MTSNPFRLFLATTLTTCVLGACSTAPVTTTPDTNPAATGNGRDDAASGNASRPAPPRPKAPPRPDKAPDKAPAKADKPGTKSPEIIVEEAPPEPPVTGPAWLSQCINRQTEGGVIRCDADSLLTEPSAHVKVYTREPGAAGRTRTGPIQLRSNLPRKYRFFVVP